MYIDWEKYCHQVSRLCPHSQRAPALSTAPPRGDRVEPAGKCHCVVPTKGHQMFDAAMMMATSFESFRLCICLCVEGKHIKLWIVISSDQAQCAAQHNCNSYNP